MVRVFRRIVWTIAGFLLLGTASSTFAQKATAISAALTRRADAIAFTVPGYRAGRNGSPGPDLLLHNFTFNGNPVPVSSLSVNQIHPGVFEVTGEEGSVGRWQFSVEDAADGYYGLGERFDVQNHSHYVVRNSSQDNATSKGSGSYKPIPFYMSTTGYGLWLDTTSEAVFDLNVTSRENVLISEPAKRLRIVLIAGPKFPVILDRFTALAGRSMLPPYWSFAPWVSRDYHRNEADVEQDLEKTRSLGLPASVLLIDSPWATGYNSYIFNPKQFAHPEQMIHTIHDDGFKLVLWHTSWINNATKTPGEAGFAGKIDVKSSNYDEAARHGYFVKDASGKPWVGTWWKGRGSLVDFTNPAAKAWWEAQLTRVVKQGADGFKDDDAEGSFQSNDMHFADGTDPRLMRNRYAVLYNHAVEDVIQKQLKGDGILFTRSATVGNQNLAMLWGGDNEASFSPENGLPTVVTAGINAGLSGMALWAADLGGYLATSSTPDPLLFMRWTEFSAFSPVMETISTSNLGPWDYGEAALKNYRKYARLNMSLFPYRYRAAQEAAETGMPILRSLVLEDQEDKEAREVRYEYLFGPDFLVAPVVDRNTSRTVYLPKGQWVDYWTGKEIDGGHYIIANAAPDVLPLYVRAGAIIPKIPEDTMTLVPQKQYSAPVKGMNDHRIYELFPEDSMSKTTKLRDFEGRSVQRTAKSLAIHGAPATIRIRWRFQDVQDPQWNGHALKVQRDAFGEYVEFHHTNSSTVTWH